MKFQEKRLLSQIILFFSTNLGALGFKTGFCYPFFYCQACPAATSACPLRALEQSVYKQSFTWRFFVYPLLILGFLGVTTGRAVCGWACPIGFIQRCTGRVARKLKRFPLVKKIGGLKIEPYLRYMKYGILIGFVFLTSFLIGFIFTDICPVGFLTGTIPILILNPGKYVPNYFFPVALVIFSLFLILIFTVERGWCRYFCPVGALLAPFNKISFLHIAVEQKEECTHCNACIDVCPMGIDIYNMHRDPECILCGKCVNVCPKNNIIFKRS
ncbi:MAG: 4Fe-4S binding protein [Euryarchaeota archaeon]|nr:4Fe-4S binding protein [Euryarchaeota archaeon]